MASENFFTGLKVIDLSTVLAGPSVGSFFAEMGADVFKVESPQGDVTRTWFANGEDASSTSAYYNAVNHNKSVYQIDLLNERDKFLNLVSDADILISNFKFGDDEKFQITEEIIRSINPKIIVAKIQGFEIDAKRVAYDVVLQAETGFMAINGEKDSSPLKMPVAFMDVLAAHQLKEGILCALLHRYKTGKGSTVSCSLEMAGIASLMNQGSIFLKSGIIPRASGSLHPTICPYGEILCFQDGIQIVLAVGSNRQFEDLCQVLGLNDLPVNPVFQNNASRVAHRHELIEKMQNRASQLEGKIIVPLLHDRLVPFGEIKKVNEVMEQAFKIGAVQKDKFTNTPFIKSVAFQIKFD